MSVVVSLSVAAEEFPLGEVFREVPAARIELDRVVPSGEALLPYVWVYGASAEAVRAAIEGNDDVERVCVLDSLPDRTLLRIAWEPTVDGLVTAITDAEAAILNASGDTDHWRFELRFPTPEATSGFQAQCREAGLTVDVTGVHDTSQPGAARPNELSSAQRELLELALDRGYFSIPRGTTLVDLAEETGVSDQAASERLRRAQVKLAAAYLGK